MPHFALFPSVLPSLLLPCSFSTVPLPLSLPIPLALLNIIPHDVFFPFTYTSLIHIIPDFSPRLVSGRVPVGVQGHRTPPRHPRGLARFMSFRSLLCESGGGVREAPGGSGGLREAPEFVFGMIALKANEIFVLFSYLRSAHSLISLVN